MLFLLLLVLLGPLARLCLTRQGDFSFVFVATAPSVVPMAGCSLVHCTASVWNGDGGLSLAPRLPCHSPPHSHVLLAHVPEPQRLGRNLLPS